MRHQPRDGVRRDDRVGIDSNEKFGVANMLDAVVQCLGLAGILLAEDQHLARRLFRGESIARHFQRAVLGSVVNHDDAQVRIVRIRAPIASCAR